MRAVRYKRADVSTDTCVYIAMRMPVYKSMAVAVDTCVFVVRLPFDACST